MKKFKSRYAQFKGNAKRGSGASSGSHTSDFLPDLTEPTGSLSPAPQEARRAITSLPSTPSSEPLTPYFSIGAMPSAPAGPASVPSYSPSSTTQLQDVLANTQLRQLAPTILASQNLAPVNATPPLQEESISVKWRGLKLLLGMLGSTAEIFPPFKAAIDGFNDLVAVFEVAKEKGNEYSDLQTKLDSLLRDLSRHLTGLTNPRMTMSMKNLCAGINAELRIVEQKLAQGTPRRYVEAEGNSDQVLECYQRIQGHLQRLTEARLRQLLAVASAVYNSAASEEIQRRACTAGTREDELVRLLGWARNKDGAEVYWMNGMAGTGKTTIAYSLCADLETSAELAASFFCSRQIPECRDVKLIIPAIAYQLARFSLPFCRALLKILEADPDVHTRVLKTQFEYLLVKPLLEVQHTLPADFIVVIDALDECEKEDSVGQIIDALLSSSSLSNLPIRFLLSSRPEPQIYSRMMSKTGLNQESRLVLHDLDEKKVNHDIATYLNAELEHVRLPPSQLAALAAHSGVLFIYASTAARYIRDGLPFRQHVKRLNMILGLVPASEDGKDRDIDALYTSILKSTFESRHLDKSNRTLMKTLLDVIIYAQEPMTIGALSGLLGVEDAEQVDGLLRPLSSVLNIAESSGLVNTLHASFPDFMRNRARSVEFHCDPQTTHTSIARLGFNLMRENEPLFNICKLESSYLRDKDVLDLAKRAGQAISAQLFYACRYWAAHMRLGGEEDATGGLIYEFLSKRLLLWMEVLNLKECMHLGPGILQLVAGWSSAHGYPKETIDLAHDAWRFVTMYTSHAISKSTPHIYLSMLPFWRDSAPMVSHYAKRMHGTIHARGPAMKTRQLALLATWPMVGSVWSVCYSPDESLIACAVDSSVHIIDGTTGQPVLGPLEHSDRVSSIAFSPDGALLASGSHDEMVKVWETNNGRLLTRPLKGHTDLVLSIAFSPDGKRIVSGSRDGTIRVWSLESGRTVLAPLRGQNKEVWSICVSSDGTRIASGHGDGTIHIWNAESGQALLGPLPGHTAVVGSICFSPDDKRLVSSSRDSTIRLWNCLDGQPNVDVLKGHTRSVPSVSFSPNGKQIVSGSFDETIRIWDVEGKPQLVTVLKGHTNVVWCARFSSDNARIVSSSYDGTIRVWDARSQGPADTPLQGHTQAVTSVAFSHDATRILSGSNDGTIYIWDAQSGQISVGPMKGHTDWVNSLCFSPDESRIASGSRDKTIKLWDAYTGQAVGEPLTGHFGTVFSVCFSPDGTLLATGSEDQTIQLWDARSGEPVGSPLEAHTAWVQSVCFSPDSLRIVSGSNDNTILVWDVSTRRSVLPPLKGHTDQVWAVCVSPDGTRIASGSVDKTVRLWDAHSGQHASGPLLGHTAEIESVSFSHDNSYVVSGAYDKTIRLWDSRSGQAVGGPLIGHTSLVRSVAFSSNGGLVVSGSEDQSIRVWDVADLVRVKETQSNNNKGAKSYHTRQCWALQDDGWVVDSESRLLTWVPPDLQTNLINPRNLLLISTKGSIHLDLESAKLGESWTECYKP